MIKRRQGFTLAEVLVTLGIIGIVAALTIPSLLTNYQKRATAIGVKRAYAELNQILKLAVAEHDDVGGWDYKTGKELPQWVQTYFTPYAKVLSAEDCRNNKKNKCAGVPSFARLGQGTKLTGFMNAHYVVTLLGGSIKAIAFYSYAPTYPEVRCYVYLNVPANRKARLGKDVFLFVLKPQDHSMFVPFGMKSTIPFTKDMQLSREVLLNGPIRAGGCFKTSGGPDYYGPGDACGAVIMLDGWEINKDYPWN